MNETQHPKNYDVARQFYESLSRSQWLTWPRIQAYQETQLQQSLAHAWAQVPFYREPLSRIRLPDGSFDLSRWRELPIIDKDVVAANPEAFKARELPQGHQSVVSTSTSGSESLSFSILRTRFEHTGTACVSFRYADWFGHRFSTPLAMIRAGFIATADPDDPEDKFWGPPWIDRSTRGARHRLHIRTPIDEQLNWLMGLGEVYLNTLASNAMALAQRSEESGKIPKIRAVLTVGEKLHQDTRDEVRRIWGCRISDVYSTAETGNVAIECPDTGNYHLQSEITRSEVLNEAGEPCREGETGRLVCTSMYNFAMPMIRYRFRDIVRVGAPCSCGRGLPVLSEILGREQGLFEAENGEPYLPKISTQRICEQSGARQWQLTQQTQRTVLLTLKLPELPSKAKQLALKAYIASQLRGKANVEVAVTDAFPRTRGGKFSCYHRQF